MSSRHRDVDQLVVGSHPGMSRASAVATGEATCCPPCLSCELDHNVETATMMSPRTRGAKPREATSRRVGSSWRPRLEILEARTLLATLPVAIDINRTSSESDDLTVLNPGSFVRPTHLDVRDDGT